MNIDQIIDGLTSNGYYVEFEMDSDFEFACFIKDGYYMETISISVMGEGKTLTESLTDALHKLAKEKKT